jgi:hypothetical protein
MASALETCLSRKCRTHDKHSRRLPLNNPGQFCRLLPASAPTRNPGHEHAINVGAAHLRPVAPQKRRSGTFVDVPSM